MFPVQWAAERRVGSDPGFQLLDFLLLERQRFTLRSHTIALLLDLNGLLTSDTGLAPGVDVFKIKTFSPAIFAQLKLRQTGVFLRQQTGLQQTSSRRVACLLALRFLQN